MWLLFDWTSEVLAKTGLHTQVCSGAIYSYTRPRRNAIAEQQTNPPGYFLTRLPTEVPRDEEPTAPRPGSKPTIPVD